MILLDTNVISELMKKPADPQVARWFMQHEADTLLCTPAIAEIALGIARLPVGKRRSGLESDLSELRIRYAERTLSFSTASAMIYGDIMYDALKSKHNMDVVDGQIAAIAFEHGMKLATRNGKDFQSAGLVIINPWSAI